MKALSSVSRDEGHSPPERTVVVVVVVVAVVQAALWPHPLTLLLSPPTSLTPIFQQALNYHSRRCRAANNTGHNVWLDLQRPIQPSGVHVVLCGF